jgi:hypothetical protein
VHLLLWRPGTDEAQVLEQEELAAVGEGGGVGCAHVVGAAPGGEQHAAVLARCPTPGHAVHQRHDCLIRNRPVEELGLGEAVYPGLPNLITACLAPDCVAEGQRCPEVGGRG